jgi:hypothetical protein
MSLLSSFDAKRIASHRIASHRIASHRIASHRIASHRIASHRIIAGERIARLLAPPVSSASHPKKPSRHVPGRLFFRFFAFSLSHFPGFHRSYK